MRKVTTRLISAALAASMMLSACPVSAFAAEKTEVENEVSTQAVTDITTEGIDLHTAAPTEKTTYQAGTGTVVYDPASKTLTLDHATIETSGNAIVAPEGVLNIVVVGENTLISTGTRDDIGAIYYTKNTTDVNISGRGTLNIQAVGYGITDNDERGSLSIEGTTVNFKCADTAIYLANNIRLENATVDIDGIDDPYGIEVFDGGLTISGSTVTIENVEYAFAVGRNNDSRIAFQVLNNSNVTIEKAYSCTIASNALIEDSTYIQRDSHFSREGSTTIKNSTFIVNTPQSVAFDSWYGGLSVQGDSYVELESTKNAFELAKTDECLTLEEGLVVLEGEMDAGMQKSTTARLVIGKLRHVIVKNGEKDAEELSYKKGEIVTLLADDVEGKIFTGWTVEGLADFNETPSQVLTFTMPDNDVTAIAHYRTDEPGEPIVTGGSSTAAAVIGTTALAGIVGVGAYVLGTEAYIQLALPAGIILPSNRIEMAELIWDQAGKPEPASTELFADIGTDDIDAHKAARWMVEQELMQVDENEPDEFQPSKAVTRLRICQTWHAAKEKGLIQ